MRFELINPSDQYGLEADSYVAALGAAAIVGEGRYGLRPLDSGLPVAPPIPFNGDWPREVYEAAGVSGASGLTKWMNACAENNEAVAKALDSITIASGERTSLNNIGEYARKYAQAMRGNRKFQPIDVEAGNI